MSDEPTVCGWQDCQNILSPSGPSLYFCSQDHQRQWYLDRARAADRYGETIVTGTHDHVARDRRIEESAERARRYGYEDGLWGLPFVGRMFGMWRRNDGEDAA